MTAQQKSTKIISNKIDTLYRFIDEDQLDDREMYSTFNKKGFLVAHGTVHNSVFNYVKKWWKNPASDKDEIMSVIYRYTMAVVDVASELDSEKIERYEAWQDEVIDIYRKEFA